MDTKVVISVIIGLAVWEMVVKGMLSGLTGGVTTES